MGGKATEDWGGQQARVRVIVAAVFPLLHPVVMRFRSFVPMLVPLSFAAAGCGAVDALTGNDPCKGPAPLVPGSSVSGVTSQGDNNCVSPDGTRQQLFTMTLSQPTNVDFQLTANGFPPHLGIYATGKQEIMLTNQPPRMMAFLPAGTFTVVVGSTSGRDGTYVLATSPAADHKGCVVREAGTMVGAVLTGSVTADDCIDVPRHDAYFLLMPTAGTLTISGTVGARAGILLVGLGTTGVIASREMSAPGAFTLTVPSLAAGHYGIRIEARTVNNVTTLPIPYSLTIN